MYTVKINGVKHVVETHPDGTTTYDPPLSAEQLKKDKEHVKEMCRTQTCPGLRTDTNFHAGRGTLLDQMEGDTQWTKYLVQQARKQGYNPGANDVYIGQLADSTGDPDAWIKPGEGRSELIKRAKKKGKGLDAPGIRVEAKPYVEKKGPILNERVTGQLMNEYKKSGAAGSMSDRELRTHVKSKHGRSLSA